MPQPQAEIQTALTALGNAIRLEPEMDDVATLKHARALVQRVFDKNSREGGKPSGYRQAIDNAVTQLNQKVSP